MQFEGLQRQERGEARWSFVYTFVFFAFQRPCMRCVNTHISCAPPALPVVTPQLPASEGSLVEKLEQLIQLQTQAAAQLEELKKSQDDFQRRQLLQLADMDRRLKLLEDLVNSRRFLRDESSADRHTRQRVLTKEQNVSAYGLLVFNLPS